ncbi:hypothetical protein Tco_1430280 [Tanacetum coccineum]
MTNKIDTVLKAITNQITGTLPSDMVKNPKLGTHPISSALSYTTKDPQSSTHIHSSINAITIHPKQPEESQVNKPDKSSLGNISSNPHQQPDPLASITTEQLVEVAGPRRKDKASHGEGDKVQPMEEQKFQRSNNFKNKQPTPVKVEGGMDDEKEVTFGTIGIHGSHSNGRLLLLDSLVNSSTGKDATPKRYPDVPTTS